MADARFVEEPEERTVWFTTPKRKERIKIFVPVGNYAFWQVRYESGKEVDGIGVGRFTSHNDAAKVVLDWEKKVRSTPEAKHKIMFGDKKPPVLKRKKVSGAKSNSKAG